MNWLRGLSVSLKVAIGALLMALAVMAVKRHKDTAAKWRNKAVNIEQGYVVKGIKTASAANSQAKIHDEKANRIKAKAEAHITKMGDKHEDVKDLIAKWGQ